MIAARGVIPMAALSRDIARPGGHVVHYPLYRGELMNFVGIVERGEWSRAAITDRYEWLFTYDVCHVEV